MTQITANAERYISPRLYWFKSAFFSRRRLRQYLQSVKKWNQTHFSLRFYDIKSEANFFMENDVILPIEVSPLLDAIALWRQIRERSIVTCNTFYVRITFSTSLFRIYTLNFFSEIKFRATWKTYLFMHYFRIFTLCFRHFSI